VTLPNFIVIGAAKAGTTALYWYLAEHPDVFMSRVKETNYFAFGTDAQGRWLYGDPEHHQFPVRSRREYEALFAEAGRATSIGEASPIYLECPQAAGRIRDLIPDARLVCALRQPVDRAYSDYLMFLRGQGRRLDPIRDLAPSAEWARPDSRWMQIGMYHQQLSRYYDAFPRHHIHTFLFEDLKPSPLGMMQELYRFLGVDPSFVPDFETPHNFGGMPASWFVERLLTNRTIRAAVEPWIPRRAINYARHLRTRNMRKAPSLPLELKQELTVAFRDDILKTSELVGRSLEHWL
jgi:hypothetical protein